MKLPISGEYPANWKAIATFVKNEADWKCIRCLAAHNPSTGYCLTVHHLDGDKSNCRWWNLLALCQRCHLKIQAKVVPHRPFMFEHSEWFKPYVAGYYAFTQRGLYLPRRTILESLNEFLQLGRTA